MLFKMETQADKVAFIVCIILIICIILIFITYTNYTKCIHYFAGSSTNGTVIKKISILNKNLVHLIDNIFWTMGFKTKKQAKKVVPITDNTPIFSNTSIISLNISLSADSCAVFLSRVHFF